VFNCDSDYLEYLNFIERAKRKYQISIYAYCLMPNHTHLLAKHKFAKVISRFMHWVNFSYTRYFNLEYGKVGHLWQGRFKGKPILKEKYLLNAATYIEGNPVRAKLVDDIADYKWSSYRERCLGDQRCIVDDLSG